ncbi:plasmid mobilization protein [Parvularcula sp. LCG005]|uniref:plasmid mobilization protein n=1 Tax=Parvularcula sp. LCG005 TaxID=3078805 RepID=UPI0029431951|nr:plasmid mobilization relaxosome protein MobC [Parvularcula sp. LCG005]WOI52977.1 plasmid mobilization relaxosome protein MobC [Parvularcula sp. LCG005]
MSGGQVAKFNKAAKPKKKRPAPISLRVTEEERALLKDRAGRRSVNAYIRQKVFGDAASPRRSYRRPQTDDAAISQALAVLGQSHLASNLNQIAKAANTGTLPVTADLTSELQAACADIRHMRNALIAALGLTSKG